MKGLAQTPALPRAPPQRTAAAAAVLFGRSAPERCRAAAAASSTSRRRAHACPIGPTSLFGRRDGASARLCLAVARAAEQPGAAHACRAQAASGKRGSTAGQREAARCRCAGSAAACTCDAAALASLRRGCASIASLATTHARSSSPSSHATSSLHCTPLSLSPSHLSCPSLSVRQRSR
jgi:hypothetical protein